MSEATTYLIKALGDLLTITILFGFLFRLFKVDYFNPIVQGVMRIIDLPLRNLRNFIPAIYNIDFASIVSAIIIQSLCLYLIVLSGDLSANIFVLIQWSFFSVLLLIIKLMFYSMFAGIILSWIASTSSHPVVRLAFQLSEPLFVPFRKLMPPMGGLDFSPILAFIALNFAEVLARNLATQAGVPYGVLIGF